MVDDHDLYVDARLTEAARRQNAYLVRDTSPHQVAIKSFWLALHQTQSVLEFDDIGLSVFSQNNEDGILLYIFSRIGFTSRKSIEIGCNIDNTTIGVPEGNSINLIVNFNFHGLIIDLEQSHIDGLRHFFSNCLPTKHFHQARDTQHRTIPGDFYSPVLEVGEVTPANVNTLVTRSGFQGDIDLLSIDIDGNDINVIDAIDAVSARVLVVEFNNRLAFEPSIFAGPTPAWDLDMSTTAFRQSCGPSLSRLCEVARRRGYVLIGLNNNLINAFFVRSDVFAESDLKQASAADYFGHRLRPPESFA